MAIEIPINPKNCGRETQATITFLKETKEGKYGLVEKFPPQLIRFEDNSAEIEEQYYYALD